MSNGQIKRWLRSDCCVPLFDLPKKKWIHRLLCTLARSGSGTNAFLVEASSYLENCVQLAYAYDVKKLVMHAYSSESEQSFDAPVHFLPSQPNSILCSRLRHSSVPAILDEVNSTGDKINIPFIYRGYACVFWEASTDPRAVLWPSPPLEIVREPPFWKYEAEHVNIADNHAIVFPGFVLQIVYFSYSEMLLKWWMYDEVRSGTRSYIVSQHPHHKRNKPCPERNENYYSTPLGVWILFWG